MSDLTTAQKNAIVKKWEIDKLGECESCHYVNFPRVSFNHQQNCIEIHAWMKLSDQDADNLDVHSIGKSGMFNEQRAVVDRYHVNILKEIKKGME